MTINKDDCQNLLDEWQLKYIGDKPYWGEFMGFKDLGNSVRGRTYFKQKYNTMYHIGYRYGMIELNSRLRSDWRIKAVLWHEFCHHWAYSVYNYSKHQGKFDDCLRTNKVLWLLGSFSRIIPML